MNMFICLFAVVPVLARAAPLAAATPREIWLEKMQMTCGKVLQAQAEGRLRQDLPADPRRVAKDWSSKGAWAGDRYKRDHHLRSE